jgi:hypothetical protein
LLGKMSIPNANDKFDEVLGIGKKMKNNIELNEIAYTELIHSIEHKANYVKIAFDIVRG